MFTNLAIPRQLQKYNYINPLRFRVLPKVLINEFTLWKFIRVGLKSGLIGLINVGIDKASISAF